MSRGRSPTSYDGELRGSFVARERRKRTGGVQSLRRALSIYESDRRRQRWRDPDRDRARHQPAFVDGPSPSDRRSSKTVSYCSGPMAPGGWSAWTPSLSVTPFWACAILEKAPVPLLRRLLWHRAGETATFSRVLSVRHGRYTWSRWRCLQTVRAILQASRWLAVWCCNQPRLWARACWPPMPGGKKVESHSHGEGY